MPRKIDYYFSLMSPWAYIGHLPFMEIVQRHGLEVNYKPVFLGRVFAETGGLPLAQRHPARQRYRLVELQRWRQKRGLAFNLQPKYWPFDVTLADRCIIALSVADQDPDPFLRLAYAAIWEHDRNLGDVGVLQELAEEAGMDAGSMLEIAQGSTAEAFYAINLENAVGADVFGSPAYVLDGEVFWGQDRLDLLDDALRSGRPAFRPNNVNRETAS
ncbi:2-hydroxychromene-2-carboxylate isomerase [Microvirga brassicacearum]|uniref:2-hydroxychromene-2-carboxylate isomerase n=1 Tax=Microvirga brassicacearum TaxID=2580413 RepID=A0A5N3P8E7_9HYPH|nr:2-hydroxychromene-2-carboxylate isomerase [Microvirga brassicacearum]KAB0265990.1 2-hydroxychromene-2-carboxylate isomerase [Microvirga brassicacearum]